MPPERAAKKKDQPHKNPHIGPNDSRRKTYWPPVAGIIAPSSA